MDAGKHHALSNDTQAKASAGKGAFKAPPFAPTPCRHPRSRRAGSRRRAWRRRPSHAKQLFAPNPPPDPFARSASHIDGAASILVGICGNIAMQSGQLVNVDDLFTLPER